MKKLNIKKIIDYILIFSIFILSIKKGGFYKTDSEIFNITILLIGILYIIIFDVFKIVRLDIKSKENKKFNIDVIEIFLLALVIAYSLSIIFKNYTNFSDSIYELIRYLNALIIYKIVKNSDNKNIYLNGIVFITIIQCLLGIDGIANKYSENILRYFNSSFLDKDLIRLSGTLQYANVLAILTAISFMIVLNKLFYIDYKEKIKFVLYNSILVLLLSGLLLTQTRLVTILLLFGIIIYFRKSKYELNKIKINIFNLIYIFIFSCILSSVISNFCVSNTNFVYYTFIVGMLLNILLSYVLRLFFPKIDNIYNKVKLNKIIIISFVIILIYIVVGLNIYRTINLYSNSKEKIKEIDIYNINKKGFDNNLKINLKALEEDTRYSIEVIEITKDFNSISISNLNYYQTVTNSFDINFHLTKKARSVRVILEVQKGSLEVENILMNNKKKVLSYLLLPTNVVDKIQDLIHGSTSIRDRVEYSKDALKIIFNSYKNLFLGVGGEGFKNLYKDFQTLNYSSTEVHNSFLQIFVESGILGVISIILVVVISFYNMKNIEELYIKICFSMFVVHCIFDLDFSYMCMMCIFSIFIGIVNSNKNIKQSSYNILFLQSLIELLILIFFASNIIV